MSSTIKAVLVMAGLMSAALAGFSFSSQQVGDVVRAVASAVWGA